MCALWEAHQTMLMSNKMKNIIKIFAFVMGVSMAVSCSGHLDSADDGQGLELRPDCVRISADGNDEVRFAVFSGNVDVTEASTITCITTGTVLAGNSFSTRTAGVYVFEAAYDGVRSEQVSVEAEEMFVSRFRRHVCVMEFTGTWCSQCPEGAGILNYLVDRMYKDEVFALAFHNDDEYSLPEEKVLYDMFKWDGYPAYVTDMRKEDCGELKGTGCSSSIEKSLYETQTHSGVKVQCSYDEASGKVEADAVLYSEREMNYRMAAYVVEDMVVGRQMESTGTYNERYTHRHVVRKMLSSGVRGDDMGKIAPGVEARKKYEFEVDEDWNAENLYVAVLALDEEGHVNNMAQCAAADGIMDYVYAQNNN